MVMNIQELVINSPTRRHSLTVVEPKTISKRLDNHYSENMLFSFKLVMIGETFVIRGKDKDYSVLLKVGKKQAVRLYDSSLSDVENAQNVGTLVQAKLRDRVALAANLALKISPATDPISALQEKRGHRVLDKLCAKREKKVKNTVTDIIRDDGFVRIKSLKKLRKMEENLIKNSLTLTVDVLLGEQEFNGVRLVPSAGTTWEASEGANIFLGEHETSMHYISKSTMKHADFWVRPHVAK